MGENRTHMTAPRRAGKGPQGAEPGGVAAEGAGAVPGTLRGAPAEAQEGKPVTASENGRESQVPVAVPASPVLPPGSASAPLPLPVSSSASERMPAPASPLTSPPTPAPPASAGSTGMDGGGSRRAHGEGDRTGGYNRTGSATLSWRIASFAAECSAIRAPSIRRRGAGRRGLPNER